MKPINKYRFKHVGNYRIKFICCKLCKSEHYWFTGCEGYWRNLDIRREAKLKSMEVHDSIS